MNMTFPASLDSLHQMLQFIRVEVRAAGFEGAQEAQVELALEEALVNIIKHGYGASPGTIEIQCMRIPFVGIKVVVIDGGIPFNLLLSPQKNALPTLNLDKNPTSGYGIYLIGRIMDEIAYEFKSGYNVLTLTKFINRSIKNS